MSAPLREELLALEGRISFHMPGHKGKADMLTLLAHMDATELNVTDDLYHAQGAIRRAQELASRSARAAHTIFLTNGATCGVEAMLGYAARPGDKVILSRACHLSAVSGCALYGLEPIWVRAWADEGGAPFTYEGDVIRTIAANPDARAVLVTRPDYFGRLLPLERIARAAHAAGMLLLVDEAHGAHLNWLDARCGVWSPSGETARKHINALDMGADICVQSAHKTLCALTGGAYINMRDTVDSEELLRYVSLTQSTSPSFLIMSSLDSAREHMDAQGEARLNALCAQCERVYAQCASEGLRPAREYFNVCCDRTRIALDVRERGISGFEAQQALTDMGIDIEMADPRRIVMICTAADTQEDFDRLISALKALPRGSVNPAAPELKPLPLAQRALGVREAALGRCERVALESAAGRIAARAIGAYPPGVAACVPGEVISREICAGLMSQTGSLFGLEDGKCLVVKE